MSGPLGLRYGEGTLATRRNLPEETDLVELADELAEIARTTRDPATGQRLMSVVKRLLELAGLPPEDEGGGEPPTPWVSEPAYDRA